MKSKSVKWYKPKAENTGWDKDMDAGERRALMLKAHGNDKLAAARAMRALANVTQDQETEIQAARDAAFFYKEYQREKEMPTRPYYPMGRRTPRISAAMPKLR